MKMLPRYIMVLCLLVISCDKNETSVKTGDSQAISQEPRITAKAIQSFSFTDYALSSESQTAFSTWEKYQELAIQISYLKKADLSFFNGDNEDFKKFVIDLKTSIPKEFRTNPVLSRLAVLETSLLILNQNLSLESIGDTAKLAAINELLVAFSNFNYQINKKLERDFYDKIQPE